MNDLLEPEVKETYKHTDIFFKEGKELSEKILTKIFDDEITSSITNFKKIANNVITILLTSNSKENILENIIIYLNKEYGVLEETSENKEKIKEQKLKLKNKINKIKIPKNLKLFVEEKEKLKKIKSEEKKLLLKFKREKEKILKSKKKQLKEIKNERSKEIRNSLEDEFIF